MGNDWVGPIILQRGLQQGDPLLSNLFIIEVEGLTALIQRKERERLYHGYKIMTYAPCISHLLFVDDAFLFF